MTSEYVPFEEGHLVNVTLSYFLGKAKDTIEEHLETIPRFFTLDCKEELDNLMEPEIFAKEIMCLLPPISEIAKEMGVKEDSEIFSKLPEICEEASLMIAREMMESVSIEMDLCTHKGGE